MSVLSAPPTREEFGDSSRLNDVESVAAPPAPTWLDRWARHAVLSRLDKLEVGRLTLVEASGDHAFGASTSNTTAEIEVLDPRFYREIALGSSLGAGDAFVKGYWRSPNLLATMRLFAKNLTQQHDLQTMALPLQAFGRWLLRRSNRNSRTGSRKNIERHYDLSNELFALFLDPTMTYSCGMFPTEQTSMERASLAKYELICDKLQLKPTDHVVELGCGWGGFAEYAATQTGCRVTGITISQQQLDFGKQRIARAGLGNRVDLRLCDYRDLIGSFDKLVSIEMIEAVGHEYLPTFFRKCGSLLKPHGQMLLQAITIPDNRYDFYRKSVDFIQKYIFPGGCLPSIGVMSRAVHQQTDMRIVHMEDFAADYARTLAAWHEKFHERAGDIEQLGFDERFRRTWDYYFCYCMAGFLERQIGIAQLLLKRPGAT